jgi:LCP family protein required for cell wall assembly
MGHEFPAPKKKKRRRALIIVLTVVLVISCVGGAGAYVYFDLFGSTGLKPVTTAPGETRTIPADELEPDPAFGELYDITDATSLKGFLNQWWYNGGDEYIRYSKNVLNVLLLGIDNNDGVPGTGRSDTMMLVSINKMTRRITMLSFLRDSYCYLNVGGQEWYHRLNSAYYLGGPEGMMEALSRLYKIKVDKYVTVDFQSFPTLIDALGGVAVDVTEAEAKYINRTAPTQKGKFPVGQGVKLTGYQALIYSRIRKLDSDVERAGRQQKVIESIIQSARAASPGQVYKALDETLPYVQTNFTRGEILGLIPSAMGWLKFGMQKLSSPVLTGEERNAVGGTINGMSILIVDYPMAARQAQLALYGESNINVDDNPTRTAYINNLFGAAEQHTRTTRRSTQAQSAAPAAEQPSESVTEEALAETTPPAEETVPPEEQTSGGVNWFPWLG